MARVRVQTEDFDVGRELDALTKGRSDVGGLASFVGLVRDANDGHEIRGMTLEHYTGMTEKALADLGAQAQGRWDLIDIVVIHRVGSLVPGDRIVLGGVARVRVQEADFDVGSELSALTQARNDVGAVASFVGLVRDANDGSDVRGMTLEHYPGMTEKALEAICAQAAERWDLLDMLVIHRVGALAPGDRIVLVGVAGAHRGEAFAACEFIMDYLKTRAPFWKREDTAQGARWVDARASDEAAAGRWKQG